jgi:IS1 family transposase/transposase-like protein
MKKRGPKPKVKGVACPREECIAYGIINNGNVIGHGGYETKDGLERLYLCKTCKRTFSGRRGTAYFRCYTTKKELDTLIFVATNGLGIRATAELCNCTVKTVLNRLEKADKTIQCFINSKEQDLLPEVVQFDEMTVLLEKKPETTGDHFTNAGNWLWTSICSITKYLLNIDIGSRSRKMCIEFVNSVLKKINKDHVPIIVTDGYRHYKYTILDYYLEKELTGNPYISKKTLDKRLKYGQVRKTRDGKKLKKMERVNVVGIVPKNLLNTSAIERVHGTLRTRLGFLARATNKFSRCIDYMRTKIDIFRVYYNFCWTHDSLTEKVNGKNIKMTPAMSMGITERIISMREILECPKWKMPTLR